LNITHIVALPLRERKDDIPLLINHFLKKISDTPKRIMPDAMKLLIEHPWMGNVRELENVIQRITLFADKTEVTQEDLPSEITVAGGFPGKVDKVLQIPDDGVSIDTIIEDIEKQYLLKALEKTGGVKTEAAKLLNITFRSFRHRLNKYGLG
jgi:two-component system response regulator PilR (NtrC family)